MKYIIMCGGEYRMWKQPRQLTKIRGEPVVARTIRMLRENGIKDIAISSGNTVFEQFGVPVLRHENGYNAVSHENIRGCWCDAFYPTDEPVCYIFGDVVFSPDAIRTIVETDTDDIEFFGSAPPFADEYIKRWAEPFALKVRDTGHLKRAIELTKEYADRGIFHRKPIMWELWQVIRGAPLNTIDYGSYTAINDYTCDIDDEKDIRRMEERAGKDAAPRTAVYCGTRNLYGDMVTAVRSLLCHDGADRVVLAIEDDEFPYPLPENCSIVNVSGQEWFGKDGPNYNSRWTYMVLMRAALSKILPDDKVLSMDVDTIVDGDISELWRMPIDDYYLAGAREPIKSDNQPYVQMGVVMFNLRKMRADGVDDRIIELLNTKEYAFPEQDCINEVCRGHILKMDSKYNANDWTEPTDEKRIIHFAAIRQWNHLPMVQKYKLAP